MSSGAPEKPMTAAVGAGGGGKVSVKATGCALAGLKLQASRGLSFRAKVLRTCHPPSVKLGAASTAAEEPVEAGERGIPVIGLVVAGGVTVEPAAGGVGAEEGVGSTARTSTGRRLLAERVARRGRATEALRLMMAAIVAGSEGGELA